MKDTQIISPAGEMARLTECALEPLSRPGAVQPHGVLFVLDEQADVVRAASENTVHLLGLPVRDVLGQPFAKIVGVASVAAMRDVLDALSGAYNPVSVVVSGESFDAIVHRTGKNVIVELEPAQAAGDHNATAAVIAAAHQLATMTTPEEVWAAMAMTISQLTGFDRVMVYHFHEDGHGQVVAEHADPDMESYLGLHFPASDIPPQARELYVTKLSRAIVSSTLAGSALVSDNRADFKPSTVDLGMAELRSVSPHHLQFMRNMGQVSTLSFSMIHEGILVGMITCAHRSPRRVPYLSRQVIEVLANQVALQLSSMAEIDRLRGHARFREIRSSLIEQLSEGPTVGAPLADALLRGHTTLLSLVPADGVMLVADGLVSSLGEVPEQAGQIRELSTLRRLIPTRSMCTEALGVDSPELAALLPGVAGIIVIPIGTGDDFVAWFRGEVAQSVKWLGDMGPTNRETPLSPRNSFSSWTQTVAGRSLPWYGLETEAGSLSQDLNGFLLRRAESKLAGLALTDPLTGLYNRRLMMDRLEHALNKYARGDELAVLFIDIDKFKTVNDHYGHNTGDLLLVHIAEQLRSTTRDQDTVARLGGDEFVVLCENTTAEEANILAERIRESLRRPAVFDGTTITVTVSVGVASANLTYGASDLLRKADDAMYRAKEHGRDRIAR